MERILSNRKIIMRKCIAMFLISLSAHAQGANDLFIPFLDSVPEVKETIKVENEGAGEEAITVESFTFSSCNGINTVYGILAYPLASAAISKVESDGGGLNVAVNVCIPAGVTISEVTLYHIVRPALTGRKGSGNRFLQLN